MEVGGEDMFDEDADDDPRDLEEVRALKAHRRYFRSLQSPAVVHRSRAPRSSRQAKPTRPFLQVAPDYTILFCNTNILLGSLPVVSELVASQCWTVVVPLAVITKLDGLHNQPGDLGRATAEAPTHLITAVQTQSTSLKVQTSKGSYLKSLSIGSEATTLGEGGPNMDDLIIAPLDHFVHRTGLLIASRNTVKRTDETSKVVLLTFDHNMRVKARSRQLDTADEKGMAAIFSSAK
ncbi:hypothetical protein FS837_004595 [Tulasnella sp. UAMH 9824]|nr:hypothetical protein FS837_004595 [Tulasnella sp. UAMH 9824]